MKPILFEENSILFTTNGKGRLSDAISCVVKEERNGQYELEMDYPSNGAHFAEIGIRSIILAKASAKNGNQPFRVYKITKPINGRVKILAQHISYDLSKNVCMPFSVTASGTACSTVLQNLKTRAVETCPFIFWTDVTTVASYKQDIPSSIRQRLGGVEGSVLDQFGGEYEWDSFTVKLHRQRGQNTDVVLRYGKNITDLNQEENIANTVTGIVPYWTNAEDGDIVTLPEKAVYSSYASRYSSHMTVPKDLSEKWDTKPTETQLRTAAQVIVNQTGFGLPKVSIDVSFINLADTEEYKDFIALQDVGLCDNITVQFEKLGISTTAEIVKTEYDVLSEKYNSVTVGELRSNMATTINDINSSLVQSISNAEKTVFAQAGAEAADLINNATAWLTSAGGYVVAVKNADGSWKELLFMDTNDPATARNVLRLNTNGLGFSRNGVGGPYTQAWTLDGKLVVGGTNVPSITCYDENNNIIFQTTKTGTIWNSSNSSMDMDGTITAENGIFNGGTITLGGNDNGKIIMKNSSGTEVGRWDRSKFRFTNGNNTIDLTTKSGNAVIYFDEDSYIDGTGSGSQGGIHLNAREVVFSVNDLGVTSYRGSKQIAYGKSGTLTDSYGTEWTFTNGLLTNVSNQ